MRFQLKLTIQPHSALREPLYRRYFVATCQSTLASWMVRFSLGWLAWDFTESAFWVGVTSAAMLLPTFVLSPIFGVLSDRISPRNGLLFTLTSQALIAGLVALSMGLGGFSLPVLLVAGTAIGAISAAHHPLRLAFIPRLVEREKLPSAIGLSATVFNLSRILGPAFCGVLIAHFSTAVVLVLATFFYVGAALALTRVKLKPLPPKANQASVLAELIEGFAAGINDRTIRLILTLTLINGLVGRTVLELLPAISGKLLAGTAAHLAWLTSAAGLGSIIGGLLVARLRDNDALLLKLVIMSLAAAGAALLLLPVSDQIWVLAAIIGFISLVTTVSGISSQALAQLTVEDHLRGRVMSFWTVLSMGGPAIGSFLVGASAEKIGFPVTLTGVSCLALLVIALLWQPVQRVLAASRALVKPVDQRAS